LLRQRLVIKGVATGETSLSAAFTEISSLSIKQRAAPLKLRGVLSEGTLLPGSVAKNILAAISCAEESVAASISYVGGKFLQHYIKSFIQFLAELAEAR
jgi:hypothetical protein